MFDSKAQLKQSLIHMTIVKQSRFVKRIGVSNFYASHLTKLSQGLVLGTFFLSTVLGTFVPNTETVLGTLSQNYFFGTMSLIPKRY